MLIQDVEDLDRVLDELETLARSEIGMADFLPVLLDRLRITLDAQSSAFLLPIGGAKWQAIASSGSFAAGNQLDQELEKLAVRDSESPAGGTEPIESLVFERAGARWMAVPVKPSNPAKGCLMVGLDMAAPTSSLSEMIEIVSACGEVVAIKQSATLESFLDHDWPALQRLCQQIYATHSLDEASLILANGLAEILKSARVSLLTSAVARDVEVRAVSGVPTASDRAPAVRALKKCGEKALRTQQPVIITEEEKSTDVPEADPVPGLLPNLVCVPLGAFRSADAPPTTAVAIETTSLSKLRSCLALLPEILPIVGFTWEQHAKWLQLPRIARSLLLGPDRLSRWCAAMPKWLIVLGCAVLLLWCLCLPYPLVIQVTGSFEPVTARGVFATADGYVEQLLVSDHQEVHQGESLLVLHSPELELLIEKAEGEIRAAEEEANSVRIAINQLDPSSADFLENQSRLSSNIEQVQTRRKSLENQLQLLRRQSERLTLSSPIDGVVVGKDLHQELYRRPVRRGDALFSVVDLNGNWQLRLRVPDRDFGYVKRHYGTRASELVRELEFAFNRSPTERKSAQIDWIADHVENQHGEGCYVEVRATTAASGDRPSHSGAGVTATFRCGEQPLWFVWCRPFIEAAQRRMWLGSGGPDETTN